MDQADFQQSNVTHHLIEQALKDTLDFQPENSSKNKSMSTNML